jgi:hypothetical protein
MRTIVAFASVAAVAVGGLLMGGCAVRTSSPRRGVQVARAYGQAAPMWIERKATVADAGQWIDVTPTPLPASATEWQAPAEVAAFHHTSVPAAGAAGLELDDLGAPPALGPAVPAPAALPAALLPIAPLLDHGTEGHTCVGGNCDVPPMADSDDDA